MEYPLGSPSVYDASLKRLITGNGSAALWSVRAPDGRRLGPYVATTMLSWIRGEIKTLPGMTHDRSIMPPKAYSFCSVLGRPSICNKIPTSLYRPLPDLLVEASYGTVRPPVQESQIMAEVQMQQLPKAANLPSVLHRLTIDTEDEDTDRRNRSPAKPKAAHTSSKWSPGMRQPPAQAQWQPPPPACKPEPAQRTQGLVNPNSYDARRAAVLSNLLLELTQLSNGMRKQFLEAKNWEMDGYLGTRPPPKGLVHTSKDHLAHLVASVPQKGVTLEVTPLTQMVPTSKHMLTVGFDVNVRRTTKTTEQRMSLAILLDMGAAMANASCAPGGSNSSCTPSHLDAAIQAIRGLVEELPEGSTFMLSSVTAEGAMLEVPPLPANRASKHLAQFALDKLAFMAASGASPGGGAVTNGPAMRAAIWQAYGELRSAGPPGLSDLCLMLFTDSTKERTSKLSQWEVAKEEVTQPKHKPKYNPNKKPEKVLFLQHMEARLHTVFLGPQQDTMCLYNATTMSGGTFIRASSAQEVAAAAGGLLAVQRYAQVLDAKLFITTDSGWGTPQVLSGLHQKHTIRNNWPESTTEVSLLPVMAPGDREQVILLVDLPQVDQPDVHFKVLKAKLKYKTSLDDKYQVQEVELHVKRSPAWQETQDVDREVRELAATRKVFRALLDAGTRLEMLDAGGARRCLEAAFASAERELPCTSKAYQALEDAQKCIWAIPRDVMTADTKGNSFLRPRCYDKECAKLSELKDLVRNEAQEESSVRHVGAQLLAGASAAAFAGKQGA